ncbi:centrosomal protein of 41 kDa-like isoform X3 [Pecten maximus]|uniref:centrosomal protein of 41 kDa-like isoform X3 n=1 Tax=Pecten maximus TaxID=6579 RepID=UPI0014585A3C|nr:centrosomal protein of 41 kDa-like isoform X3 [Pecten maximus]
MPKKGNPSFYNSSYMTPRKAPPRPRLFKEDRFKLSEILKEAEKDYKLRKDEIFKRMKVTTFVQLLVQVADFEQDADSQYTKGQYSDRTDMDGEYSDRPDTADREVLKIQEKSHSPRHTDRSSGAGDTERTRSKLQNVVTGVGEIREDKPQSIQRSNDSPYLLLDVRDADSYKQCHLITAKHYPKTMLSRSYDFETKDMLAYRNQPGKIIVVYDEDETIAHEVATTLVQRFYENLFLLSGGMRVAYKAFPEGLFTGTPSQKVTEAKNPPTTVLNSSKDRFTEEDIDRLHVYLDSALSDRSVGSRLSNASTSSSRIGGASQMSKASKPEWAVKGRKAFKP